MLDNSTNVLSSIILTWKCIQSCIQSEMEERLILAVACKAEACTFSKYMLRSEFNSFFRSKDVFIAKRRNTNANLGSMNWFKDWFEIIGMSCNLFDIWMISCIFLWSYIHHLLQNMCANCDGHLFWKMTYLYISKLDFSKISCSCFWMLLIALAITPNISRSHRIVRCSWTSDIGSHVYM